MSTLYSRINVYTRLFGSIEYVVRGQNQIGPIVKFAKSQNYVAVAAGSQSAPLCVNIILMDSKLVGMGALIGDITVCM